MKKSMILGAALLSVAAAGAQKYNMVVETTDGQKTIIPVDNIESMATTPQPDFIAADHFIYGMYTKDINNTSRAVYRLDFANAPTDQSGLPYSVGDMTISIEFTAPVSENSADAILPTGNYKAGNNTADFTFNCSRSDVAIRVAEGDAQDAIAYEVIVGGFVDVDYRNGEYDIRAEVVTLSGLKINAQFQGPVKFINNPANSETFTEDIDVTFEGAQGRYYANWYYPFADDARLQFFTGHFDSNNSQTDGYWLEIEMNLPKAADPRPEAIPSPRIADGVYNVDLREDAGSFYYSYHPFSFVPGRNISVMGQNYNTGTLITLKEQDGTTRLAHINGGTLTVSENGTKFAIDFTTTEGVKVTGTYSDKPNIVNFCDNFDKQPARPYSTLTADHTLTFADNAIALAFDEGDNFIYPGKKTIYLMISDPEQKKNDYIAFEIVTDDNGLVDGTYTVNDKFEPFGVITGRVSYGGQPVFSWFGNLEQIHPDGYNEIMAPVNGGTITVATDAQGISTITIDVLDDNNHKITGSWTGKITHRSEADYETPASLRSLKLR